jgi:hypothetical protein
MTAGYLLYRQNVIKSGHKTCFVETSLVFCWKLDIIVMVIRDKALILFYMDMNVSYN